MEYQLVKTEDVTKNVNLTLTMGIVKILHNACVDILKEEPTLTAYKAAMEELEQVILDQESKTVRGVLTVQTQPRTLDDIYSEMCSHPDFVAGSYYDKDSVIEMIATSIEDEYPDDENEPGMYDIIYKDAEEIYKNNSRRIFKNIDSCYEYAFQDIDVLEDCDLTIEKQTK